MAEGDLRKGLGDFSSIICLKSIMTGLEEIMGTQAARGNLVLAGRKRGQRIAKDLDLVNTDKPIEEWSEMLANAIGKTGTRLCTVNKVENQGNIIHVYLSDTVCSANEEPGSPRQLTFTLGAIQGALETIMNVRLSGSQIGSILRGQDYDIIEFKVRQTK